jgi:hypothetical protein
MDRLCGKTLKISGPILGDGYTRNADYWIIPFGLLITTIGWLPFLFNKSIEFSMKFEVLGVMYVAGLIYWFVLKPPRKNIK